MNDIDHDDEAELIPLPPTPPMSRGRAFGLLTGIAALTLLFAKPDFGDAQHPDPESFMSHPENMAGVSDTLKAFAPEVAKRLTADNIKTRFVYTSAMADQIYSHFTDENQKKLQAMLEKFRQDGRQDDLVFGFISHFEGVRPKSYDDSEGVRTIGCGYAMSKPGTLIGGGPEKFMCETLGIDKDQYKEFYKGDRALSFSQMRKLTMDWIRKNNGIRESLNGTLSKITGQEDAINLLDPVHKACLLTMMYQSPAALTGMGKTKKQTRETTYPLLGVLCDVKANPDQKLQAMLALNDYYAENTLLKLANPKQKRNPMRVTYAQRAAAVSGVLSANVGATTSPDLIAAQIHVACYSQQEANPHKEALIIIAGKALPVTVQELLENKKCMWNTKGRARIVIPDLALIAVQNGEEITVSSWVDENYGYTLAIQETKADALDTMNDSFKQRGQNILQRN